MPKILETQDLRKLIDRNTEQNAELNAALIAAAALWGLKASELSLVEVGDILTAKGELKRKWILRKEVSFNRYVRELYTEHESLVNYLNRYLEFRVNNRFGTTNIGEYRGLDPASRLFLTDKGKPFNFTRRSAKAEGETNLQPTGMNNYFKRLIKNSCISDLSFRDFRSSIAVNMYREGSSNTRIKKTIMEYLGIRSYDALMKILNSDPKSIHDMVKGIYKRI